MSPILWIALVVSHIFHSIHLNVLWRNIVSVCVCFFFASFNRLIIERFENTFSVEAILFRYNSCKTDKTYILLTFSTVPSTILILFSFFFIYVFWLEIIFNSIHLE